MTTTVDELLSDTGAHVMRLPESIPLSDDQFLDLCHVNRDLRLERTSVGEIIAMGPVGGRGSKRNLHLTMQLAAWADQDDSGVAFDSSLGVIPPNTAVRSPDASWVKRSRLSGLGAEQKEKFLPFCPDFTVELRSCSDSLRFLQFKMEEYIANGCRLGWLIDPLERKVHIYRAGRPPEILNSPGTLSGESVLPGFSLELGKIWELGF